MGACLLWLHFVEETSCYKTEHRKEREKVGEVDKQDEREGCREWALSQWELFKEIFILEQEEAERATGQKVPFEVEWSVVENR